MWFQPPREIPVRLFSALPAAHRRPRRTPWSDANRGGAAIDSFLEGPCFDATGGFLVTDIPNGRIFRVGPTAWDLVAEYDGWPNGMAAGPLRGAHAGEMLITDYKHGLLSLDAASGAMAPVLETVLSEGFRGLNDLVLDAAGAVLMTDQGQTGLQDPSGRVLRLWPDGRIDRLISNGPSPNGIALNKAGSHCYGPTRWSARRSASSGCRPGPAGRTGWRWMRRTGCSSPIPGMARSGASMRRGCCCSGWTTRRSAGCRRIAASRRMGGRC